MAVTILCTRCQGHLQPNPDGDRAAAWNCPGCGHQAPGGKRYVDLLGGPASATADHYTLQWGGKLGFLEFLQHRPRAKNVLAAAQLGWDRLFAEIRERAKTETVSVYDAACGFGGIANELITAETAGRLRYVGADIHDSLELIAERVAHFDRCGLLIRHDIGRPLPVAEKFDYVICRAALHHTPDPDRTFAALRRSLKPGGTLTISVYRRKAVCREALDDHLRAAFAGMSPDEAFAVSRQFTVLGKALRQIKEKVTLDEDLPFLGIPRGTYDLQYLIYYYFLKCFYNDEFGERYSTLVNYDWYHPQYAYRYDLPEVQTLFEGQGLEVRECFSSPAQHYVVGQLPPARAA